METTEPQKPWKRRAIAEGSPEHLEWRAHESPAEPVTFGEFSLKAYKRFEEKEKNGETLDAVESKWRDETFADETKWMLEWYDDKKTHANYDTAVAFAVTKIFSDNQKLADDYKTMTGVEATPDSFVGNLRLKKIPKQIIAGFFQEWGNFIGELQKGLEGRFPKDKEEFIAKTPELVADGTLAPDTDVETVRRRLAPVTARILDPLDENQTNNRRTYANYGSERVGVLPISHDGGANIRHNIFHEFVHAGIAGRKITEERGIVRPEVHEQKSGLLFSHRRGKEIIFPTHTQFHSWMNEAKTEKIARRYSGYDKSDAYSREIEVMERELVAAGIPDMLITEAYQENYLVGAQGVRLPKYQDLLKKIDETKGKGWLLSQNDRFKTLPCEPLIEHDG